MTVHLLAGGRIPNDQSFDTCIMIESIQRPNAGPAPMPNLGLKLEHAFTAIRDEWSALVRSLQETTSARLAHGVLCNSGPSDLGAMLAWTRIVDECAATNQSVLIYCDDPWLFRHLAEREGVQAGAAPPLFLRRTILCIRGYLSRLRYTARALKAKIRTQKWRDYIADGRPAIVVYAHPSSSADGADAYFPGLLRRLPDVVRLLHTDGVGHHADSLLKEGLTANLNAWGSFVALFVLPFKKWRPSRRDLSGSHKWLVRRAASREGATGSGAQAAWQEICQNRWMQDRQPSAIAWPWENHPWERMLTATARKMGIRSIGYQHTVVGLHMYNLSPCTLRDGVFELPDHVVANGPAFEVDLLALDIPPDRIQCGGALRFNRKELAPRSMSPNDDPVLVVLPSKSETAREMLRAIESAAQALPSRTFLIKEHPMYACELTETSNVKRTNKTLYDHDVLSAVVFASSSVGLESLLIGIRTVRFLPSSTPTMDVIPTMFRNEIAVTDAETLVPTLQALPSPPQIEWEAVFTAPKWSYWEDALSSDCAHKPEHTTS